MTATVPGVIAWPLLAAMAAVVVLRYLFFNHGQWERYLNHTLALMFAANLVRERAVQDVLTVDGFVAITTVQYLTFVLMIFAGAEFLGFIEMWSRPSPADVRRRQRHHRLVASMLSAGFMVATHPARVAGHLLEQHVGWSSVIAWAIYVSFPVVDAARLWTLSRQELRAPKATRNERLVAIGGLLFGLTIGVNSSQIVGLAILEQLGLLHSGDYRAATYGQVFLAQSVGGMFLAALPLALAATALAGCDVVSRRWRRLQPLRAGMLAAVPRIAYDAGAPDVRRRKSTLDLHQTSVQIRDAILALRPYFRDVPRCVAERFYAEHAVAPEHRQDATDALQLAYAVHAEASGLPPTPTDCRAVFRSRSATLNEETEELLRLGRWWPAAAAAAAAAVDRSRAIGARP